MLRPDFIPSLPLIAKKGLASIFATTLLFGAVGCDSEECPSTAVDMVELQATALGVHFLIDGYEASAFDASATSRGSGSEIGCNVPLVQPRIRVSFSEAKSACDLEGKRLCTKEEWQTACGSLKNRKHPYADAYDATKCRGDVDPNGGGTVPTGSMEGCKTIQQVADMSGNVREWVIDETGKGVLAGGGFASGQLDLSCAAIADVGDTDAYEPGPGDGFRCCKSP